MKLVTATCDDVIRRCEQRANRFRVFFFYRFVESFAHVADYLIYSHVLVSLKVLFSDPEGVK